MNEIIGRHKPCYIIAEIGQAHDGSLGTAYAYIDALASTGVNAVKFQTHIADAESTCHDSFRVKGFPQDHSRYDYWKRMEFTETQWKELSEYTKTKGMDFLSTPFSVEAINILNDLVPFWKVGSGDLGNTLLMSRLVETGKGILLSTGMSSVDEIDKVVKFLRKNNVDFGLFQCTTAYPCSPESIGYNILSEYTEKYNCVVGLSDHSGTIYPSLAAVSLGAKLVEVHVVFSRHCFGPDTNSSLLIEELKTMVEGVRFIEKGLNNPVDKDHNAELKAETKKLFSRSAFYNCDLEKGSIISKEHISMKKPGGGLAYEELSMVIGKCLLEDKVKDEYVQLEDAR